MKCDNCAGHGTTIDGKSCRVCGGTGLEVPETQCIKLSTEESMSWGVDQTLRIMTRRRACQQAKETGHECDIVNDGDELIETARPDGSIVIR